MKNRSQLTSKMICQDDSAQSDQERKIFEDLFRECLERATPLVERSLRREWSQSASNTWRDIAGNVLSNLLNDAIASKQISHEHQDNIAAAKENMKGPLQKCFLKEEERDSPDESRIRAVSYNLSRFLVSEWLDKLDRQAEAGDVVGLTHNLSYAIECEVIDAAASSFPVDRITIAMVLRRVGRRHDYVH